MNVFVAVAKDVPAVVGIEVLVGCGVTVGSGRDIMLVGIGVGVSAVGLEERMSNVA